MDDVGAWTQESFICLIPLESKWVEAQDKGKLKNWIREFQRSDYRLSWCLFCFCMYFSGFWPQFQLNTTPNENVEMAENAMERFHVLSVHIDGTDTNIALSH